LIDNSNRITPNFKALTLGHTTSAAEEIQKVVSKAKVVKALNTILAELLPHEARKGRVNPVQASSRIWDQLCRTGADNGRRNECEAGRESRCRRRGGAG
jgi:hypothetical protein